MAFSARKRTSRYIKTDFNKKEYDPLDRSILYELTMRLRGGDTDAIKPIIESHLKLATRIAGQYVHHSSNEHEMLSAALEAIFDGCLNVMNGKPILNDDITGYLVSMVHTRCHRRHCENHLIRIPLSTLIAASKQGKHVQNILLQDFQYACTKTYKTPNIREEREYILSCCETSREITIIRLKEQRYTNTEIAETIGVTKACVGQTLNRIHVRYLAKQRKEGFI